ncbi:hypothetical protein DH2020_047366 [Rehmannia glutinosa]|uniref:EGF-like domain-containing protein n=1 Tax=Rehmannia glutinosa TaxID=99300 RepID=A0ABR0U8S1_REHGL
MELRIRCNRCAEVSLLPRFELNFAIICVKVLLVLLLLEASLATTKEFRQQRQVYVEPDISKSLQRRGRALLGASDLPNRHNDAKQPIRIYLNYDAVGHSSDRDCRNVGDIALGQTADWFKRALSVEPVRGNLRLSGYSACGQDGGVQLPREYVEEGVANADLVLLVTTRPTTGNTLAWAVACERDQWGRAIAGHVNVAPRHLTAEAETLLSATLIHEVMHVLGFDPHAFAHFRDERKRRRTRVTEQAMDEKLGRVVTRVVLPRVIMHSRYHYGAFSENFTGLELEDGGGRGTSGCSSFSNSYQLHYSTFSFPYLRWIMLISLGKRLLMNEIMTGSVDTRSVVSKMTLALLEDSGWYRANYSMADRLDWGRNQGTEFVTFPCNLWKGAYRCNSTQFSGCTYNREAEGYCPIVNYSGDLPEWARYFPQANKVGRRNVNFVTGLWLVKNKEAVNLNTCKTWKIVLPSPASLFILDDAGVFMNGLHLVTFLLFFFFLSFAGGQSSLADYCTYFVAYSDGSCTDTNSARHLTGCWVKCGKCMASSLVRSGFVRGSTSQGNGCYQHRCINNSLEVAVDGLWKVCPEAGGPVKFPGFNGNDIALHGLWSRELICPAYNELCNDDPVLVSGQCPTSCHYNGHCIDGRCHCFLGFEGHDCSQRSCPNNCAGHGECLKDGVCDCEHGYTGIDCSTVFMVGSVTTVSAFRCSDYAGYTCQNSSTLLPSLSACKDVLEKDKFGQHCAPSELSILQQLEQVVVMPNYHRLFPGGPRKFLNYIRGRDCDGAAKRLACWISIQKCDEDGDNRLRVCHSACQSYNQACGASLDCSDQTLFSHENEGEGLCTGWGEISTWL